MKRMNMLLIAFILLVSVNVHARDVDVLNNTENQINFLPGKIVVKFKPQVGQFIPLNVLNKTGVYSLDKKIEDFSITRVERKFSAFKMHRRPHLPDLSLIYELSFPEHFDPVQVAAAFSQDKNVEYAEPLPIYFVEIEPNDSLYLRQTFLPQISAPQAWDISQGDSSVVIAIVDNGTHWKHPDLFANIFTNEIEANGIPGVDDDGNGFIDDMRGWDFAEEDNDPTNTPPDALGYWIHGTHVAGLVSAITNNTIGIASIGWNCTILPLKCSYEDSPRSITFGYDGIVYSAEMGADIINCSWGGFGAYSQFAQDVIDYATGLGSLVLASAGNVATDDIHYPSGYLNVLSVTWVASRDQKAPDATWGICVDVAAPGVVLLSTFPPEGGSYGVASGSSMAAPVTAGLCGLVKSLHPDWNPKRIAQQVVFSTDNIDDINPLYAGLLGSGRINAYHALSFTEEQFVEPAPHLALWRSMISDSVGGNNNGVLERGETIEVNVQYRNFSLGAAYNTMISMSSPNLDINLLNNTVMEGNIPGDTIMTTSAALTFSISEQAAANVSNLIFTFTADGGFTHQDTIQIIIGKFPLLLVDDDHAGGDGTSLDIEKYYTPILDSLKISYAIWDHSLRGAPSGNLLVNFPIVVWFGEWSFPTLEVADQQALTYYLDHGGNLFISGQDIGWELNERDFAPNEATEESREWYQKYLHAIYLSDNSNDQDVVGIDGDPIGDGLSFQIYQPGRTGDQQFPDLIAPAPGASAVFEYSPGNVSAIRFTGAHRVVYFGFGLEAIDATTDFNPNQYSATRELVMKRILNWINPIIHHPRDSEDITNSYPILAIITGDTSLITAVNLYWNSDGSQQFNQLTMAAMDSGKYMAEIPAATAGTSIYYYIEMENPYFNWQSPIGAPKTLHAFFVGQDTIPPTISALTTLPNSLFNNGPFPVKVFINDNINLDPEELKLHYTIGNEAEQNILLTPSGVQFEYGADIPAGAILGDTIKYWVSAKDMAATPNLSISPQRSLIFGLEDFESGLNYWNPVQGWGLETQNVHSGNFSINDSPGSKYPDDADLNIETKQSLDLTQLSNPTLFFWTRYFLEKDKDFGFIEVSTDSGESWQQLGEGFTGVKAGWFEDSRSLKEFNSPIFLRFRTVSDESNNYVGWFLDDIRIVPGPSFVKSDEKINTLPDKYLLFQNYPNPFNPTSTIRFALPNAARVSIKIFDILGREVKTLIAENKAAGYHTAIWDGTDIQGKEVATGIYIYQLKANDVVMNKKMLLIR